MTNYECVFCKDKFDEAKLYKRHIKAKHEGNTNVDQTLVELEMKKLSDKQSNKKFACDKCKKGFTTKYIMNNHICKNTSADNDSKLSNIIDKEVTSYESGVKLMNILADKMKKYNSNMINSPIQIQGNNNVVNNNNITNISNIQHNKNYNVTIYNIGDIDMSKMITPEFINKFHSEIVSSLENNKRIDYEKIMLFLHYKNNYKDPEYIRKSDILESEKLISINIIKRILIDKILDLLEMAFFSPDTPDFHIMYIMSDKMLDPFYVRVKNGWIKTEDINDLHTIIISLYKQIYNYYAIYRPNSAKISNEFFLEKYNIIILELSKRTIQTSYKLRYVVQDKFEKEKDIVFIDSVENKKDNKDKQKDDISVGDINLDKYLTEPKPTYIMKEDPEKIRKINDQNMEDQEYNDQKMPDHNTKKVEKDKKLINNEEIEEEHTYIYTNDDVGFYEDVYKRQKYYISPERNNAVYKKPNNRNITQLSSDELIPLGIRLGKNRYDIIDE